MNRDDIIRMAADAGITPWVHHQWVGGNRFADVDEGMDGDLACLVQFANLVAAAEREACAKVAEANGADEPYGHAKFRCYNIADAIRARGKK